MNKVFMFLCIVLIFIGISGFSSFDDALGIGQSSFDASTSRPVTTSKTESVSMDNDASPIPEPATILLIGSGLVGLAVIGRKKFKK